jgi:predicted PurR-regulated permease PerM
MVEETEVSGPVTRAPLLRSLLRLPLKKVAIWLAFLLLLWALRPFFGLVFLTFVLSYMSTTIVDRISGQFTSRRVAVVLVFAGIVGAVVALGFATIPRAVREGQNQLRTLDVVKDPKRLGKDAKERDPRRAIDRRLSEALGGQPDVEDAAALHGGVFGAVFSSSERRGESALVGAVHDVSATLGDNLSWAQSQWVIPYLRGLLEQVWTGVVFTLMALLFSFMLVWDGQRISAGIERLATSRLGDVYVEVAPSIATFGRLLGRAFEAQTLIALVNTFMTAIGLTVLGVSGIGLLSVIVFLCSFIPIAGVFISTVPICLVALTQEGGSFVLCLGVVVMVVIVHIVEAYVLNPRIYGHHMKLHPLAVLVVLYLGQHLFGLWGLIIGVPLATYLWRHVIMGEVEVVGAPGAPAPPVVVAAAPAPLPPPAPG